MGTSKTTDKIRRETMLQALKASMGIVKVACDKAGVGRSSHYRWMKSNKAYREAVNSITEDSLDFVESKLFELINGVKMKVGKNEVAYKKSPDVASIIFYLKTKGKDRGYTEKQEISFDNGLKVNVKVVRKEGNNGSVQVEE